MKQSVSFWEFTKLSVGRATRQYFQPYYKSREINELEKLLEATKDHVMTPEEREEQRRSFARGNVALSNPVVTREVIDRAADKLSFAEVVLNPPAPNESAVKAVQNYREWENAKLAQEVQTLRKLVDAADYLQHCRRSAPLGNFTSQTEANRQRVQRASDHYDFLRGQVKL